MMAFLLAQAAQTNTWGPSWLKLNEMVPAVVFSVMGTFLFCGLFWVIDKMTPGSLWKELIEEHNTAVAVLFGAWAIALGIIIAAAIVG
jgi:uncharacterized membrane protein YjfL (UPF0719 family)